MKQIIYYAIGSYINILGVISKSKAASLALRLFTTPMKGFVKEDQEKFLESAFQEEYSHEGQTIVTYRWPGDGKTVLLVHGWESNSGRWKQMVQQLKFKNFNIVALDAPAHGKSGGNRFTAILYAEFINVVVQRFQPEIIIGHSVGGMATAFAFDKYNYDFVKKLILLGSPSQFKEILKRYVRLLHLSHRVAHGMALLIKERYDKLPAEFSTAQSIISVNAQGLIIHDETDPVIPFEDALEINQYFKNSKLISTQNLGHSLNHSEVYSAVEDFIAH